MYDLKTLGKVAPLFRLHIAAIVVTLSACGENPVAPGLRIAAQVIVVEGDSQLGTVHQALPGVVRVRFLDDNDVPVAGQIVAWHVVKGGGHVFAGFGVTNDSGLVQEQWTLGDTAGVQLLEARAIDSSGTPLVIATVVATAQPGPKVYEGFTLSRMVVPADSSVTLPVEATDIYGNQVPASTPVSLDVARFGVATATWTPHALGDARFVLGSDTLKVQVRWPAGRWRTATDSGALVFVGLDTANVIGGSGCSLNGTARYNAGGRLLFLRICEFPGFTMSDLYVNANALQPGSYYAPIRSEAVGRWVYPLPAGDSLVITP